MSTLWFITLPCATQRNICTCVCLSASACIVFVCLCFFGSLSVSVCLCLCVYLQRLTARDLSSSRRGQYPSHHPLCLFFSKRNFRFAFLFLMCTFLFFSSNKSNLDVPSNMFPIWQSRKGDFFRPTIPLTLPRPLLGFFSSKRKFYGFYGKLLGVL